MSYNKILYSNHFNDDELLSKEEYLKRLETMYENQSWQDILILIREVINLQPDEKIILNIIDYVSQYNKISFKQWKVLRLYLKDKSPDKKFKYGR